MALGITTSTSIRSRQSGSGTSFALLSYWPCFGLAREKAMRTRHERNSYSTRLLSGFVAFFDPGVGKSGAKRSGSSANAPFFTARGFENSASFDSFSASAWTAELRRSRWRCSNASAVFVAFAFANMLVRVAKLTSFVSSFGGREAG